MESREVGPELPLSDLTSSANSRPFNSSPSLDEVIDLINMSHDHQHIDIIAPIELSLSLDQRQR